MATKVYRNWYMCSIQSRRCKVEICEDNMSLDRATVNKHEAERGSTKETLLISQSLLGKGIIIAPEMSILSHCNRYWVEDIYL